MTVSLDGVSKSFGHLLVLDDITDVFAEGEMTALLGPSGSGKSTLLRIIAGLTPLDSGRVLLSGRDVTKAPARDRHIGFCFQDYAPFRHLSVFGNIAYGLKVQRIPRAQRKAQVDELLGLVRLEEFADRYPHQLSGGQRQRMALARALAIKPDVLLLDEPFGALDAQVRGELRSWVRSLQRELGITTILVTHDQSEAMEIADRLVILNDGNRPESPRSSTTTRPRISWPVSWDRLPRSGGLIIDRTSSNSPSTATRGRRGPSPRLFDSVSRFELFSPIKPANRRGSN